MRTGTNLRRVSRLTTHIYRWTSTVSNSAILSNNYVSLLSDHLSAHAYKRENGVTNEAIVIEWAAAAAWWRLGGSEKAMGRCTALLKMLLFRAKTIVTDWGNVELSCLKKEEEERKKENNLPVLRVPGEVLSRRFFAMRGVLSVMKTLEDERYVVIKAYKCTVSEIRRDFFCIGMYCVYVVSLHIDSTESMILLSFLSIA